jgi:membrane protease subunit (stomatin/prohibitin family)
MIDVIQANYTPGKIKKILEGAEPTAQFYNKAFGKYHAVVEEGLNTATQKQMQFAQLLQLREAGVPIPDDVLLDNATLQNKKQLIEAVQAQQQQAQQAQQAQMQMAMAEQESKIELAKARATADQGLGLERVSRVEENRALAIERIAEAKKDQEIGLLNLVKALKEIDSVDIEHVEKLIALSRLVKEPIESAAMQQVPTQNSSAVGS